MLEDLQLSKSEKLLIWRRRSGLTQAEAAQEHGVSHRRWGRWERGDEEPAVDKEITTLAVHEQLLLLRRRNNVSQGEVARDLGCTRAWVQMMEAGVNGCEQLVRYWKERVDATA